jgi:hypothetical protein
MFGLKNPGAGNILAGLSAAAGDLGHPGQNRLAGVLQNMQQEKLAQEEKARKLQTAQQVQQSLADLQANPNATRQDYFKAIAPALLGQENFSGLAGMFPDDPKPPTRLQTPDGIVEIGADGPRLIYENKPKPETHPAPSGFRWKPDGSGLELIPGFAEGQASLTGERRKATIALPMPSRARSSGGGGRKTSSGATAKLPAGFVLD